MKPGGALVAFVLALCAQDTAPVIRVDVREVWTPVIVTDSKGHNVGGLKASDFRVQEDGVPQEITAFTTADDPAARAWLAAPANSAGARPGPQAGSARSTYIICMDSLHTSFADAGTVGDALKRVFAKEKPGAAQFGIVSVGRQLQVIQTATADPALVAARASSAAFHNSAGGAAAASLRAELTDLKASMYQFCRRCPACGTGANARVCDTEIQALKIKIDTQAERWALQTRQMLVQLKAVVAELAKLPTGRTLVFVSDGFPLRPARDFYAVVAPFLPSDGRFREPPPTDLEPDLEAVIRAAANTNVRIYTLDARGVVAPSAGAAGSLDAANPSDWAPPSVIRRTPPPSRGGIVLSDQDREASSVAFDAGAGLEQLAGATGGIYFHGSNDTGKSLRAVFADGREYYLLGYVPKTATADGKFRTITVEVRNPKWRARAKSGYWPSAAGQ